MAHKVQKGSTVALRTAARTGMVALLTAGLAWSGSSAAMANDDSADRQPNASKPVKAEKESGPAKENHATKDDKLGEKDRALLSQARSKGDRTVTLILATTKGTTAKTTAAVKAAGGTVGAVEDSIGYVRATVPTSAVEKVAGLAKVLAVDLNESIPLPDPTVESSGRAGATASVDAGRGRRRPRSTRTCRRNEIGSVDFRTAHPTWDGRGVTIGVIDSGVDLDHPALQTTTTGERKIVDWVTATDPLFDGDGTWRRMLTEITGPGRRRTPGRTWTLPSSGTYKVNAFSESITAASEPGGDVNRDGDTTDRFGVLYDSKATNDIWVDANQNFTFEAGEKMRPYKENFDVGHFGTDNPATDARRADAVRRRVPQGRRPRPGNNPALPARPTSSTSASSRTPTAATSPASPRATASSAARSTARRPAPRSSPRGHVHLGWWLHRGALTDGHGRPRPTASVDVVNMSIGGLPGPQRRQQRPRRLYDALIDEYGVQLVHLGRQLRRRASTRSATRRSRRAPWSASASSVSKETWAVQLRLGSCRLRSTCTTTRRAVRVRTAASSPTSSAPGSAISSVPLWLATARTSPRSATQLPVGYAMFNGTSMACPAGHRWRRPAAVGRFRQRLDADHQAAARVACTPRRCRSRTSRRCSPRATVSSRRPRCVVVPAADQAGDAGRSRRVRPGLHGDLGLPGHRPTSGTGLYNRLRRRKPAATSCSARRRPTRSP
jgi:hypothetical protein